MSDPKAEPKAEPNQLKTDPKLNLLKKIVSHSCLLITILSAQYVLLGVCALIFGYLHKSHLYWFAFISSMQLVCAPLGWYGISTGNKLYLMILSIVNIVWMILTFILLFVYWLIMDNQAFDSEIALHVGVAIFLVVSITLAVSSFLLMRQLNMVSVSIAKPGIKLSPEGKASQKK